MVGEILYYFGNQHTQVIEIYYFIYQTNKPIKIMHLILG